MEIIAVAFGGIVILVGNYQLALRVDIAYLKVLVADQGHAVAEIEGEMILIGNHEFALAIYKAVLSVLVFHAQCVGVHLLLGFRHLVSLQVDVNPFVVLCHEGYAILKPIQIGASLDGIGDGFEIVLFLFFLFGIDCLHRHGVGRACRHLFLFAVARDHSGGTKQQHD